MVTILQFIFPVPSEPSEVQITHQTECMKVVYWSGSKKVMIESNDPIIYDNSGLPDTVISC